jgi:membrane protease YdiL (CAAX protease family)
MDEQAAVYSETTVDKTGQYSLVKIVAIWAAAALPMAVLGWIIFPLVSPSYETDPLGSGVTRVVLLTLGLMWEFVLCLIILRREEGSLGWGTIKRRLWLQAPRDPKSGHIRKRLWLWAIPALLGVVLVEIVLSPTLQSLWVAVFPFLSEPPGFDFQAALGSQAIQQSLVGAWWFLALFVVFQLFNTFLGEELLFRGILLPKMEGVFGRWSWVANGVIFGFYHLHQPWGILGTIISTTFFLSLPAWRCRSTWMSIVIHSAQSVYLAFLILGIVLGLA